MELEISDILKKYYLGELNTNSAAELLISCLDIETDDRKREEIIRALNKIHDKNHYKHIENIIISEENANIKIAAVQNIINNYKDNALEPLIWALTDEVSLNCRVEIVKSLLKLGGLVVRNKILELISQIEIKNYKKELKKYFKKNKNLTLQTLGNILINYWTIENLNKKYDWMQYKIKDGVVSELDVSDTEIKVRWPIWENNIETIEEIDGLTNLRALISLKLANNRIKEIKSLEKFSNLVSLNLANNNIKEIKGLEKLEKLEDLDLSINQIQEIKGLENLKNLKHLNLSRNEIKEVKGIKHLKNLESLNLRGNKIQNPEKYEYKFYSKYF